MRWRRRPKLLAPLLREAADRLRKEAETMRRLSIQFPDYSRALDQAAEEADRAADVLKALAATVKPPPRRRNMEYWR
jgi:ABC-type transporter Mla subunit MlaD